MIGDHIEKGALTCLRYDHGEFVAPDHSFPDFIDGRFNDFMLEVRANYRRILRVDSV